MCDNVNINVYKVPVFILSPFLLLYNHNPDYYICCFQRLSVLQRIHFFLNILYAII